MAHLYWPDFGEYGLRLRLRGEGAQRLAVMDALTEEAATFADDLAASGFERDDDGIWTCEARRLSPASLRKRFPALRMREVEQEAVLILPQVPAAPARESEPAEVEEDVQESSEARERIEDFGEHIGGARKERWSRSRGIRVENATGWTPEERASLVTKDRVWPAPKWRELADDGVPVPVLFRIKRLRDAIQSHPGYWVRAYSPSGRRVRTLKYEAGMVDAYLEAVGGVADAVSQVRTKQQLTEALHSYLEMEEGLYRRVSLSASGMALREFMHTTRSTGDLYSILQVDVHSWNWDVNKSERNGWPHGTGRKIARVAAEREEPRRPLEHIKRVGGAVSLGRDVVPEDFLATFGFRGGEFGNWVSQAERQESLNHSYHALCDLAAVLNVEPEAVSLGGTLAIAFGARGSGRWAAHYEPGRRVINLTKPSGAGALAHEWAHALDHWLATSTGSVDNMTRPYASVGGRSVRDETGVLQAFDRFVERMMTAGLSLEELDRRLQGKWEARRNNAAHWAYWCANNAAHVIGKAILGDNYDSRSESEQAAARAEAENNPFVMQLRAIHTTITGGTDWIEYRGTLADELGAAFKRVCHGKLYGMQIKRAISAIGDVQAPPTSAAKMWPTEAVRPREHTSYVKNAKRWDGKAAGKANAYYSQPWEMFARAFETCVAEELTERGWQNDYLVHGTGYKQWSEHAKGNPYPDGEDLTALRGLFGELRTKLGPVLMEFAARERAAREESETRPSEQGLAP